MATKNKILTVPNFSLNEKLIHGFTTRVIGDDLEKLAKELNISSEKIIALEQIHSDEVVCVESPTDVKKLPPGDALVTNIPGYVIGVRTADCLPILICDRKKDVVAAVHVGWRGLFKGVVQNTLNVLLRCYGCQLENLEFAFGPCISPQNYEVDQDLINQFRDQYGIRFSYLKKDGEKPRFDLVGTARMILEDIGFYYRNLAEVGLCTYERDDLFYSYRREPGKGRQFNFIGLS